MASRRFRSQPALQRSSGSPRSALLGLLVLAGIGLAVGALIGKLVDSRPPPAERIYAPGPTDQPAVVAPPVEATAPAQPPTAAPPIVAPLAAAPANEPRAVRLSKAKPDSAARPKRIAKPERPAAPPAAPQETWAEQQQAYEKARSAYDADERTAGYRWAEQNRIRAPRYCHVAAQRTPAFMEGCLNYLKARSSGAPHAPAEG